MNAQEMKAQFTELYNNMKEGKDVSKMIVFGTAFSLMFDKVATAHPDIAAATLEYLTSMEYNNFVTPAEAFAKLMGAKDNESLATASYTMAVKKLKDRDRPKFIREYFDLDDQK